VNINVTAIDKDPVIQDDDDAEEGVKEWAVAVFVEKLEGVLVKTMEIWS